MKWLPIDTAPRDGSVILLADYSGYRNREMWIASGLWVASDLMLAGGYWFDRVQILYTPTHWMSLPEAPYDQPPEGRREAS
jgi:hypothetical protein